jgi:hypothetical protein
MGNADVKGWVKPNMPLLTDADSGVKIILKH